jgi:CRP-like cAMP-binding protein
MKIELIESLLTSHPVISGAPRELIRTLARNAVERRVEAGQLLCGESERTGRVWFVGDGLLHATIQSRDGTPVTVDVIRPGEAFGYLNCFMSEEHTEDISGLVSAQVVGIPSGQFGTFVTDHQPAAQLLLRETAERMRGLMRLRAISTEPALARVRSVLTFLYDKLGSTIPMTRPMIAMVAGLTTETVSRAMAPLRRKRLIILRRGVVEIIDGDGLRGLTRPARSR